MLLTKAEVQVSVHYQVDARPEEAGLWPPVPWQRIKLAIWNDIHKRKVDDIIRIACQDNRFGSKASRWDLRHNGEDYWGDWEVADGRQ